MIATSIPPALAAAVYPPALLIVALILDKPRPLHRALVFLAGAATVTLGVGLTAVLVVQGTGGYGGSHREPEAPVDIGIGILLLLLAAIMARRPRREPRAPRAGRWQRNPLALFLLGAVMYIPSVFFISSLNEIAKAKETPAAAAINAVVVGIIALALIEVPIVMYAIWPQRTRRWVANGNQWLSVHLRRIIIAAAAVIGTYLVVSGITQLPS